MKEVELQRREQVNAARAGVKLWRNNTGALKNDRGQWVQYGLGKGTSDLIGLKSVVITPEMVGRTVAVFVAAEVKGPGGKMTPEQSAYLGMVYTAGGIATLVDKEGDVERAVETWMTRGF